MLFFVKNLEKFIIFMLIDEELCYGIMAFRSINRDDQGISEW